MRHPFLAVLLVLVVALPALPAAASEDLEMYKFLMRAMRAPQRTPPDYVPAPWRDYALGQVLVWNEFAERYSASPLVSHAYLRMAEWYLTIKKGVEGLKLLTRVIERFPNDLYFAHVGDGEFAWNDKVGAVALYMRGLLFRGGCKQDLARLRRDYPNSPSTRDAQSHFAKSCFQ